MQPRKMVIIRLEGLREAGPPLFFTLSGLPSFLFLFPLVFLRPFLLPGFPLCCPFLFSNFCFSVSFLPFFKKKKKFYVKLESHPLVHIYFIDNSVYWQRCYAFRHQIILNLKSLGESYQTNRTNYSDEVRALVENNIDH